MPDMTYKEMAETALGEVALLKTNMSNLDGFAKREFAKYKQEIDFLKEEIKSLKNNKPEPKAEAENGSKKIKK